MATQKTIRENDYTFMQDPYGGRGDSWGRSKGGGKEELGEEEWVSLNQLPKTQEMRRDGGFCVPKNKRDGEFI